MRSDYQKHFLAGMAIAFVVVAVFDPLPGYALICAVLIGGAKELIWDKWLKRGTLEWPDFLWTAFGGLIIELLSLIKP